MSPARRELLDVLTCIREGVTRRSGGPPPVAERRAASQKPARNGSGCSRRPRRRSRKRSASSTASHFRSIELSQNYPQELRAGYATEQEALEAFTWEGAAERLRTAYRPKYDSHHQARTARSSRELDYAAFFLTVHDIVRLRARRKFSRKAAAPPPIRSSASASASPTFSPRNDRSLFERFISRRAQRTAGHRRRFRARAARRGHPVHLREIRPRPRGTAATVITYRSRSAIREVGKAFGFSEDVLGALAGSVWSGYAQFTAKDVPRLGLDPDRTAPRQGDRTRRSDRRLSSPSVAAHRRLRHHADAARRGRADRQCRDGRPHRCRMGQGRSRRARTF